MGSVSSSPVSFDSSSIGIDSFGIGWIAADSSSHQLATKTASAVGEVSYCYASTGNSAGLSSIWFLIVLNSSGNLPSQEEYVILISNIGQFVFLSIKQVYLI